MASHLTMAAAMAGMAVYFYLAAAGDSNATSCGTGSCDIAAVPNDLLSKISWLPLVCLATFIFFFSLGKSKTIIHQVVQAQHPL